MSTGLFAFVMPVDELFGDVPVPPDAVHLEVLTTIVDHLVIDKGSEEGEIADLERPAFTSRLEDGAARHRNENLGLQMRVLHGGLAWKDDAPSAFEWCEHYRPRQQTLGSAARGGGSGSLKSANLHETHLAGSGRVAVERPRWAMMSSRTSEPRWARTLRSESDIPWVASLTPWR